MELEKSEFGSQKEDLFLSDLHEWVHEPLVISYGAILICRRGEARLRVNFKEWEMYEGAVMTVFPNDIVQLMPHRGTSGLASREETFQVEMLKYNAALLREASLQLEQTVYSSLREDRCRQDSPIVHDIIDNMFGLLRCYFRQPECTCLTQLVLFQLKAFFIGFHEYLCRNPQYRQDDVKSKRIRELFNHFMMLVERDYKISRDVSYYAEQMNITSKYLTNIASQVAQHTPKVIIDHYVILQIKQQLHLSNKNVKEIAWEYHFSDVSFFCRYFKRHTGMSPNDFRERR